MSSPENLCDFTSSCYLGLQHASHDLAAWDRLTAGAPIRAASSPELNRLCDELAALQGCERATLSPSTLHLFWDMFGLLSGERVAIYLDAGSYPVAHWGIERAVARGVPLRTFPHHHADALRHLLERDAGQRLRPLVVADGLCPDCGRPAPIREYLEHARRFGGQLILDDSQAIGILGAAPSAAAPYGRGGGGALRWGDVQGPDVLSACSLAKGFGVPLAVLSGGETLVRWFEAHSETQMHCSPPSMAAIRAVQHALEVNRTRGDELRLRLAERVRQFRERLQDANFESAGGSFPVQTLTSVSGGEAEALYDRLLEAGFRTLLRRGGQHVEARVSLLINANHSEQDIDDVVQAISLAAETPALDQTRQTAGSVAYCITTK